MLLFNGKANIYVLFYSDTELADIEPLQVTDQAL
jgi:hypothetical protein